jgi:hypothetical protein
MKALSWKKCVSVFSIAKESLVTIMENMMFLVLVLFVSKKKANKKKKTLGINH